MSAKNSLSDDLLESIREAVRSEQALSDDSSSHEHHTDIGDKNENKPNAGHNSNY